MKGARDLTVRQLIEEFRGRELQGVDGGSILIDALPQVLEPQVLETRISVRDEPDGAATVELPPPDAAYEQEGHRFPGWMTGWLPCRDERLRGRIPGNAGN